MDFVYSLSIGERTCVYSLCRVVRTQATKTLETYLQRIKALTASYPDTALPPSSNASEMAAVPRMATANADDSSWAGWAISSFTKKLNTASGEIERGPTPNINSSSNSRPLVPFVSSQPTPSAQLQVFSAPHPIKQAVTPLVQKLPLESYEDNKDNDPDAWGDLAEDDFFDAPVEPSNPETLFPATTDTRRAKWDQVSVLDMSSVFKKSKGPLPKGLAKMSSTVAAPTSPPRTGPGPSFPKARENIAAPVKGVGSLRPIVTTRRIESKKLQDQWGTADEEDWGDAWDK